MEDTEESDCCGNGCANCVLNIKETKSHSVDKSGKQNILETYTNFLLLKKTLHRPQVDNVWELHFKSKHSNNKAFTLVILPGYHVMMRKSFTEIDKVKSKEQDTCRERKYLLRPYSPFWWDGTEMEFKILVDIIPNGPMSDYITKLEINDEVEFRGPIGTFEHYIDEKGDRCLLIISQGIAIAPVISIIEDILNNECDMIKIIHIGCFRDLEHAYFREKLYNFSKYWNYKVHIYLSQELCVNVDCINNSKCLEMCHSFKNKLFYKEIVVPHRLMDDDFRKIVDKLSYKKENTFITISGNSHFQNYFKELCETVDYGFLKNNIYLL